MNTSIIIPTRNRAAQLKECLQALLLQVRPGDEIIVADNGSSDGTPSLVRQFTRNAHVPIRLIREKRRGASFVRNAGARAARGKILVFLDDDCLVSPGWLQNIQKICQNESIKTGFAFHQGKYNWNFQPKNLANQLFLDEWQWDWELVNERLRGTKRTNIDFIHAGNFFVRTEILKDFPELFNSNEFPFYGEERDLAARVQLAGYPIVYHENIAVEHRKKDFTFLEYLRKNFHYGRTEVLLQHKYQVKNDVSRIFDPEITHITPLPLTVWQKCEKAWKNRKHNSWFLTAQKMTLLLLKHAVYETGKISSFTLLLFSR